VPLRDDETFQAVYRFAQILILFSRGEHGVGEGLDALIGHDQAVSDLLQAFEDGTKWIIH